MRISSSQVAAGTSQSVFSNELFNYGSSGADFEIRSGVSSGNGGTLVASATGHASTQAPTGRTWQGVTEYTLNINNLDITLAPGEYWLMVRSVTYGCGGGWYLSRGSTTSGANAMGNPIGDGRSFFNRYSQVFVPTSDILGAGIWDFSYGIEGSSVPEPATFWLLGTGLFIVMRRVVAGRRFANTHGLTP